MRFGVSLFTSRLSRGVDRADWKNGNCLARGRTRELAEVLRHVGLIEVAERDRRARERDVRHVLERDDRALHSRDPAELLRWDPAPAATCARQPLARPAR